MNRLITFTKICRFGISNFHNKDDKTGIEEVISSVVYESAQSDGCVENLKSELDKLRDIVGMMAQQLPTGQQIDLAKQLGYEERLER